MLAEEGALLSCLPKSLVGANVFDAGCGSGRYLKIVQSRGATVYGADLSPAMLAQCTDIAQCASNVTCATLQALPIRDGWADWTVCGLTVGHLDTLTQTLMELKRITRPGGKILCSDFHPMGQRLGWKRTFKVGAQRYEVRHTTHEINDWLAACMQLNLSVINCLEPYLDPNSIPTNARFDPVALTVPVALVFEMKRAEG